MKSKVGHLILNHAIYADFCLKIWGQLLKAFFSHVMCCVCVWMCVVWSVIIRTIWRRFSCSAALIINSCCFRWSADQHMLLNHNWCRCNSSSYLADVSADSNQPPHTADHVISLCWCGSSSANYTVVLTADQLISSKLLRQLINCFSLMKFWQTDGLPTQLSSFRI